MSTPAPQDPESGQGLERQGSHSPQRMPPGVPAGWQPPLFHVSATIHPHSQLPSPEELHAYNSVEQGLARELVDMTKKEQDFRHEMTRSVQKSTDKAVGRNQRNGLVALLLLLILAGIIAIPGDAPDAAAWMVGTTAIGLVALFAVGRYVDSKADGKSRDDEEDAEQDD